VRSLEFHLPASTSVVAGFPTQPLTLRNLRISYEGSALTLTWRKFRETAAIE
jgi:hypothetical protein